MITQVEFDALGDVVKSLCAVCIRITDVYAASGTGPDIDVLRAFSKTWKEPESEQPHVEAMETA